MGIRITGLAAILTAVALAITFTVSGASAQVPDPDPGPFADLEAFSGPQLSPDGRRVAAICAGRGVRSVCVYDLTGSERPRMYEPPERASVGGFYWASNRHIIIDVSFAWRAAQSDGHTVYANERGVILNVETGDAPIFLQNMRQYLGATNQIGSLLTGEPDAVLAQIVVSRGDSTSNTGTRLAPGQFATMRLRVNLNTGRGQRIASQNTAGRIRRDIITADGRTIGRRSMLPTGADYQLETPRGQTLFAAGPGQSAPSSLQVIENGAAVALGFSSGSLAGLHRLDLETGALTQIVLPGDVGNAGGLIIDERRNELVGGRFMRDNLPEQRFSDPELRDIHTSLAQAIEGVLPGARVSLTSWSEDRMMITVAAVQRGRPAQYFLFDGTARDLSILGSEAPALDETLLGAVEAFRYEASDGLSIPAFLTLPPGMTRADGPFPLVALPHGGPRARDTARFDWWAQYYASLGYAVLQPNFRGSTGYGLAFEQAGHGEFGGLMIQDIADGAAHLVREGVAREGGYCAAGGSYGGYAALMLGLIDRDNVRCIIAFAPVTDPVELVAEAGSSGLFWERYIGERADVRANPAAISPARRAGEFSAPILLMHGVEDSTVPVRESRHLERNLRGSGRLHYIEMHGVDHDLTTADSRRQLLSESAVLLREHLPVE